MAQIRLPVFEGPLDLLLHLIERDDLDITAVSLVVVTDQYLKAIHNGQSFDPGALAEFVSIGAKLIYLKSKALLPRAPNEPAEMLEDDDVGRELVDLLREYKRFTQVVNMLEQRQNAGLRNYTRMAVAPMLEPESGLGHVTVDMLTKIMMQMLERTPPEPRAVIVRDSGMTLHRRVGDLREQLRIRGKISFRVMIGDCTTRLEIVVTFMAILELLKAGECDAQQSSAWSDIEVVALVAAAKR